MIEILILFVNLSMESIIIFLIFNKIITKDSPAIILTIKIDIVKEQIINNIIIIISNKITSISNKIIQEMVKTAEEHKIITIIICSITNHINLIQIFYIKCKEIWHTYSICFRMELNNINISRTWMSINMSIVLTTKIHQEIAVLILMFFRHQPQIEFLPLTISHNKWKMIKVWHKMNANCFQSLSMKDKMLNV